ncbi:hypothetical protein Scep_010780 [Stephania cephalantha]|uniref:Uncharacterized protein n=1 Tax=Stephania cephalantha TaxID=152367 RepID=A0AAP0PFK7_9MAGN
MASTVGARRVWSRAVLVKIKNRARFNGLEKKKNKKKKKKRVTTIRASSQKKKKMIIKRRQINGNSSVIKRSDELRRLVPGGEGMDFCRLLGETAHYIECLNTQVQVMQSLVDAQKPSN